jgi:2-succinyl-6-hydroxy-2,4-cyclohexadiene-1-carboxylate synthase
MLDDPSTWPVSRGGSVGTPILFLHGWLGHRGDWLEVVAALPGDRAWIAVDLPGHGENVEGDALPEFPDVLTGLERLRMVLNLPRWHVAGYSMGGRLALALALVVPEHIASLTMIAASPGVDGLDARQTRRNQDIAWATRFREQPGRATVTAWYQQPVFASLTGNEDLLADLIAQRSDACSPLTAEALVLWGQGVMPSLWGRLEQLSVPVCHTSGALDPWYVAMGERMAKRNGAIERRVIDGAGHTVHLERPVELGHSIGQFLSSVEQRKTRTS